MMSKEDIFKASRMGYGIKIFKEDNEKVTVEESWELNGWHYKSHTRTIKNNVIKFKGKIYKINVDK